VPGDNSFTKTIVVREACAIYRFRFDEGLIFRPLTSGVDKRWSTDVRYSTDFDIRFRRLLHMN